MSKKNETNEAPKPVPATKHGTIKISRTELEKRVGGKILTVVFSKVVRSSDIEIVVLLDNTRGKDDRP